LLNHALNVQSGFGNTFSDVIPQTPKSPHRDEEKERRRTHRPAIGNTHPVTVQTFTIGTEASGRPLPMNRVSDIIQLRDGRFIVVAYEGHCMYVLRANKSLLLRILGTPGKSGHHDGAGTDALFNGPQFVTVVGLDYAIVTDRGNHCSRRRTVIHRTLSSSLTPNPR
jgi:hypothetical protein